MNERDFTKVPNIEYPGNLPKFTCGVVLDVHEYKYYVPVSSYKMQKPDIDLHSCQRVDQR